MQNRHRAYLVVALFVVASARVAAQPPQCQGGESYEFKLEMSIDGGYVWTSTPYMYAQPGQSVDVMLRTVMSISSGQTEGWSLGVEHDPSWPQYYAGNMTLSTVWTTGTDTETAKGGGPPDTNVTEVRTGFNGYTQGVLVDNSVTVTLPPTSGSVTSIACYTIQVPAYSSYYVVPFSIVNDIGNPPIYSLLSPTVSGAEFPQ